MNNETLQTIAKQRGEKEIERRSEFIKNLFETITHY
jgi:hypothetical protein